MEPDAASPAPDAGEAQSAGSGPDGLTGLPEVAGDMDIADFRRYGHDVVDRIAEYLVDVGMRPVLPPTRAGDVRAALEPEPPEQGEPMQAILADFDRLILPNTTHWNHPGFLGYFGITGSGPGILGEMLAAALNINAMLWRTGPAATELEDVSLDWLRQLVGLPDGWTGVINDTASSSTLHALAAAREAAPGLDVREQGLAGRPDIPPLRIYCSEETHSSIDRAAVTLGLGTRGVVRLPTDDAFRLSAPTLEKAIARDREEGLRPIAVVATVGTTSTTSVDPVPKIAEICAREDLWLHVDAAYGGAAAVVPELRGVLDGVERADSLVINPHKWLFVPIDCSALYTRRPDALRRAFSVAPDYLATPGEESGGRNLMDYGHALGRRFRALKLWFVLRYFGAAGLADRIREHVALARRFAAWVDDDDAFERLAPVPLSVVVFRYLGASERSVEELDAINERILGRVNSSGEVFLSHTRVRDRFAIRLAVGNLRTTERHIRRAWERLREAAEEIG